VPQRSAPQYAGVVIGVIEALRRLSTHPMLDRLIRGRTWIAIVAFALIGIVTLQLGLLKLNAGIGHALRLEANLQRENAALSIENSELAAGDVVESSAGRLGMEVVPVGALRFLTARPGGADSGHGAAALKAPLASASGAGSTPESSSATTAGESAKSASSSEAPAESGESTTSAASESTTSTTSESQETKPPSESSASRASTEPTGEATTSPAASATPGRGSTEPSGGTQAGTTGR
jgi:hypothetical protein